MTINGISRMTELDMMQGIYAAAYSRATATDYSSASSTSCTEQLQISTVGNFMNAVSQMSSSDQSSIKSFMDDLVSSVQDGSFDASTIASSAPSALSSYAEENGIDLTQLVQDLADGAGHGGPGVYGPPPPPPPVMPESTGDADATGVTNLDLSSLENLSSSDKSELKTFLTELAASVEDGTFDASTMASEAPDSLTSLAEENGIDLTQLVQDLADGIENGKNAPPPPPPPPPLMPVDASSTSGTSSSSNLNISSLESLSSTDRSRLEAFFAELIKELGIETTSETGSDSTSSVASA